MWGLVLDDTHLCIHVVLHLEVVTVQMVRRDIQQDGDIRTEIVHIVELETAEFDDIILMRFLCYLQGEGVTDVTCQSCIIACLLEDMVDERGGCGLTVRTRDTDHLGIRVTARKLNLTDDMDALFLDFHNHRGGIGNTRALDDLVSIENLGLCVLPFLPLDMTVIEHLLILICNLRHV